MQWKLLPHSMYQVQPTGQGPSCRGVLHSRYMTWKDNFGNARLYPTLLTNGRDELFIIKGHRDHTLGKYATGVLKKSWKSLTNLFQRRLVWRSNLIENCSKLTFHDRLRKIRFKRERRSPLRLHRRISQIGQPRLPLVVRPDDHRQRPNRQLHVLKWTQVLDVQLHPRPPSMNSRITGITTRRHGAITDRASPRPPPHCPPRRTPPAPRPDPRSRPPRIPSPPRRS